MNINSIIIKSIIDSLNAEEQRLLDEWLKTESNKRMYNNIRSHFHDSGSYLFNTSDEDVDKAWAKIGKRADSERKPGKWVSMIRHTWRVAAAVVAFIIIGGGMMWYEDYTRTTPPVLSEDITGAIRESVKADKADILLATDKTADIPSRQIIKPQPISKEQIVEYQLDAEEVERILESKMIETQRAKESWVQFDDGTMVHLGNNSRIIYPERFPKASLFGASSPREVIVEGEAYFMVAHDASRQFIVHTRMGDIIDYGTEFYVSTKFNSTRVALVSGKIGVKSATTQERILQPGQEASIAAGGSLSVAQIDIDRYVAWNTGKYVFHEATVRKLIAIVSMWYGREVQYDESLAERTVSGVLYKYVDIRQTLESLSLALGVEGKCFNVRNTKK